MLSVPRALTSKSVSGSTSEVVTATCAARCRTASWSRTWGGSAAAFLTSSLTNVSRLGSRVSSHFRLRSVPGRLRLSRIVTCQPCLMRWWAALMPRKPAPPLIRARRSGGALGVSSPPSRSLAYRALGSTAPDTLSGRYPSEVGNGHDPRRAGEDEGLAPRIAAARIHVRAGQEQGREGAVDHVQDAFVGVAPGRERCGPQDALHRCQHRHDEVARPEPSTEPVGAEVGVSAPQAEHDREHEKDARAVAVEERERVAQSAAGQAPDRLSEG